MRDCLLLVDVFNDFRHDDGARLLSSFEARLQRLLELLDEARAAEIPVIYANDSRDGFDGLAGAIVERALSGPAGAAMAALQPVGGDRFVVKPRYSAFDYTPLGLILEELAVERIVLAGMSTEGCVAQTAIAAKARLHGLCRPVRVRHRRRRARGDRARLSHASRRRARRRGRFG
jgi:nicotinamidase-related amidase